MDFDPRDFDSRDDDVRDRDREEEWREPGQRRDLGDGGDHRFEDDRHDPREERDRGHEQNALQLGRGPSSRDDQSESDLRDRHHDRWPERDRDTRQFDPREVFQRDLKLPRRPDRELVYDGRGREYYLRGSETRTLSTVGAFRVVSIKTTRRYLNITDEELRRVLTGVWERRRQLKAVGQ